ncbi:MAG: uracil-DNA glycosylase family protein [Syntrophomonadaceae bacterium]|nr:uracil-DNA glycosylase family protein [Syntrophomonadaceae bacterium]
MSLSSRENNIRRIINMEDRVCNCDRCKNVTPCVRKPSLGKGELEPELLLVFESESLSREEVLKLRNIIKEGLNIDKIYHTYLVRCQPKVCTSRNNVNHYSFPRLIDNDSNCLLTGQSCSGIPVPSNNDEIIACMPFLIEEIQILNPKYVLLMGDRVSMFVLKSFGYYNHITESCYEYENMKIMVTVDHNKFSDHECQLLKMHLN